ncbi:MAG: hypothetical protein QXR57_05790 [Metallosphaera sp.]
MTALEAIVRTKSVFTDTSTFCSPHDVELSVMRIKASFDTFSDLP